MSWNFNEIDEWLIPCKHAIKTLLTRRFSSLIRGHCCELVVIDNLGCGGSASGWKLGLNDLGFNTDEEAFAFFLLFLPLIIESLIRFLKVVQHFWFSITKNLLSWPGPGLVHDNHNKHIFGKKCYAVRSSFFYLSIFNKLGYVTDTWSTTFMDEVSIKLLTDVPFKF